MGHDASPIDLFGIYRLGLVTYHQAVAGLSAPPAKHWVFIGYELTSERAFDKVTALCGSDTVLWRV